MILSQLCSNCGVGRIFSFPLFCFYKYDLWMPFHRLERAHRRGITVATSSLSDEFDCHERIQAYAPSATVQDQP